MISPAQFPRAVFPTSSASSVGRARRAVVPLSAKTDGARAGQNTGIGEALRGGLSRAILSAALLGAAIPPALAFRVAAPMEGVSYEEVTCGARAKPGFTCVRFRGTVTNTDKEAINTADIYGRIYDKAGNDVTDNAENDRIGFVDLVPPGTSEVSFEVPVSKSQLEQGRLVYKGLKVSGYTGKVLPGQSGLLGLPTDLDCSAIGPDSDPLDVEACEEQSAELAIR
eukprot:jgi/Tetstr1/458962/TSEL_004433.t1